MQTAQISLNKPHLSEEQLSSTCHILEASERLLVQFLLASNRAFDKIRQLINSGRGQ